MMHNDTQLICADPRSQHSLGLADRVAPKDVTVLLCGESGTGKEVFARHIHARSPRAHGPFVAVNCAAIPEQMLEAELFGFEKGAFTGALRTHAGKFEQAQGGTLLLDEISEIDLGLQAKLLRVLQEREVERLCGGQAIPLDVRVIATTNRDLKALVQAGGFREDLYYRLHVFPLKLLPLRERTQDILPLAEAFLHKHGRLCGGEVRLAKDAQQALLGHSWPGNVRELENVIQRALVMVDGGVLTAEALMFDDALTPAPAEIPPQGLKGAEQQAILETLRRVQGSRRMAARRLGISERTLRYKLARMRDAGLELPGVGAEVA